MIRLMLCFVLACRAAVAQADTEWGRVRAYFSAGVVFSQDDARFSRQTPYAGFNLDKNWRAGRVLHINSFFEARATSIAVNAAGDPFPSSQKAAHAAAGFYAPLIATRWEYAGSAHALFAAPLAVAGFETPAQSRADRFFSASGAGVRLGHFRMPRDHGSAPELISWLDAVYGKYTALDPRGGRLAIDGTLKAPGTPFTVGFSANLGRTGGARDDLRFFLGARFDLGALMAKLR